MSGLLWLLVGPSGAGKDAVLKALAGRVGLDHGIMFAKRIITRVPDHAGEAHNPVTPAAFLRLREANAFCLDWESHGLSYALGCEIPRWLDAGQTVFANGARSALPAARSLFKGRLRVLHLTAPQEILVARLASRGREAPEAIQERLRFARVRDEGLLSDFTIINDCTVEAAVSKVLLILGVNK